MTYEDFTIDVRPDGQGGLQLDLRSTLGYGCEPLRLPRKAAGLGSWLRSIEKRVHAVAARPEAGNQEEAWAAQLGQALFKALLAGSVASRYRQMQGHVATLQGQELDRGLRLRIVFRTDVPGGPPPGAEAGDALVLAAALPWEFLCDPETGDFLARSFHTPIVRSIPSPRPLPPLAIPSPIRVLVVWAAPRDCGDLDLEREVAALQTTLEGRPLVAIEFIPHARFDAMREHLRRERFHILHFLGHGAFDARTGDGYLGFEKLDGTVDVVSGRLLAEALREFPSLRLVVLNACESGMLPRERHHSLHRSLGAALAHAGVPAVVAMQFQVSDAVACRFSEELYARLAANDGLEVAVAEARRLFPCPVLGWATPVLFLSAKDGRLLSLPASAPLRLGVRSIIGWDRDMSHHTDRMLCVAPYFDGRFVRDPDDWANKVWPDLDRFLEGAVMERVPLFFNFAAHGTIAFAAGFCLEAKSGADVTILQRGAAGPKNWRADDGPVPAEPVWNPLQEEILDESGIDLALAIGITWPVSLDVREYLLEKGLPLRRLILAEIHPQPGALEIANGAHAFQLANALVRSIRRDRQERGVLHLFVSGPNGFQFYLGQLARRWGGTIQLYEHDYEKRRHGSYEPSLRLPVSPLPRGGA